MFAAAEQTGLLSRRGAPRMGKISCNSLRAVGRSPVGQDARAELQILQNSQHVEDVVALGHVGDAQAGDRFGGLANQHGAPSVGSSPPKTVLRFIIAFINVLLPEPLGPNTALNCRSAKVKLMSCKISSLP